VEIHAAARSRGCGSRWWLALWPGLAPLWLAGAWSGVGLAVSFAALFNLVMITTLVYGELVTPPVRLVAWLAVGGFWAASALAAVRWRAAREAGGDEQDLFPLGLSEYLQGNWFETEMVCQRLLERNPADVEACLLLASAQRRSGRFAAARETLLGLVRQPGAACWHAEIQQELARTEESEAASKRQLASSAAPTMNLANAA